MRERDGALRPVRAANHLEASGATEKLIISEETHSDLVVAREGVLGDDHVVVAL